MKTRLVPLCILMALPLFAEADPALQIGRGSPNNAGSVSIGNGNRTIVITNSNNRPFNGGAGNGGNSHNGGPGNGGGFNNDGNSYGDGFDNGGPGSGGHRVQDEPGYKACVSLHLDYLYTQQTAERICEDRGSLRDKALSPEVKDCMRDMESYASQTGQDRELALMCLHYKVDSKNQKFLQCLSRIQKTLAPHYWFYDSVAMANRSQQFSNKKGASGKDDSFLENACDLSSEPSKPHARLIGRTLFHSMTPAKPASKGRARAMGGLSGLTWTQKGQLMAISDDKDFPSFNYFDLVQNPTGIEIKYLESKKIKAPIYDMEDVVETDNGNFIVSIEEAPMPVGNQNMRENEPSSYLVELNPDGGFVRNISVPDEFYAKMYENEYDCSYWTNRPKKGGASQQSRSPSPSGSRADSVAVSASQKPQQQQASQPAPAASEKDSGSMLGKVVQIVQSVGGFVNGSESKNEQRANEVSPEWYQDNHHEQVEMESYEVKKTCKSQVRRGGIQFNRGIEALTMNPQKNLLYFMPEGPFESENRNSNGGWFRDKRDESKVNLYVKNMQTSEVSRFEYSLNTSLDNGVSAMTYYSDRQLLVMERGFDQGKRQAFVKIYLATLQMNKNGKGEVKKTLVVDMEKIKDFMYGGFDKIDNYEGMTLGPKLANGNPSLVVVSDNNFSNEQKTDFLVLEIPKELIK